MSFSKSTRKEKRDAVPQEQEEKEGLPFDLL
jgi:hypothetical protein